MARTGKQPIYDCAVWDKELGRWVPSRERATRKDKKRQAAFDFETFRHPFFWVHKANDLHAAARYLWEAYAAGGGTMPLEKFPRIAGYPDVVFMLGGMALENQIKAIIPSRTDWPISNAKLMQIAKGNHDLVALLRDHKIRSNKSDRKFLAILSQYIRWGGRYMLPKKADDFVEHRASHDLTPSEIWDGCIGLHEKFGGRAEDKVNRFFAKQSRRTLHP